MFLFVLLPLLPLAYAAETTWRVLHRVNHPKLPTETFTERGFLSLSGSGPFTGASLVPSEGLASDLLEFAQPLHNADASLDNNALYQVALEHPGDTDQSQWDVSSVKAVSNFILLRIPSFLFQPPTILASLRAAFRIRSSADLHLSSATYPKLPRILSDSMFLMTAPRMLSITSSVPCLVMAHVLNAVGPQSLHRNLWTFGRLPIQLYW